MAEGVGFEPTVTLARHNDFQDRRPRPLGEPSADNDSGTVQPRGCVPGVAWPGSAAVAGAECSATVAGWWPGPAC